MKAARNIVRRVVLVLLAAALGAAAYFACASGIARNQLPMPFGVGLATVESNSMQPAFSRGDLLVVGQADDIAVGDVVVYQDASIGLVVHRVVSIDGQLVTTQGDANNTADTPFDKSLVVGRVLTVVPYAGAAMAALKSPVGVIALIAILLLLVELPLKRQQSSDEAERKRLREEIAQLRNGEESKEGSGSHGKIA